MAQNTRLAFTPPFVGWYSGRGGYKHNVGLQSLRIANTSASHNVDANTKYLGGYLRSGLIQEGFTSIPADPSVKQKA